MQMTVKTEEILICPFPHLVHVQPALTTTLPPSWHQYRSTGSKIELPELNDEGLLDGMPNGIHFSNTEDPRYNDSICLPRFCC